MAGFVVVPTIGTVWKYEPLWCLQTVFRVPLSDVVRRDIPAYLTGRAAQEIIGRERPHVPSDRGPVQRGDMLDHVRARIWVGGRLTGDADEERRKNKSATHDSYLRRRDRTVER